MDREDFMIEDHFDVVTKCDEAHREGVDFDQMIAFAHKPEWSSLFIDFFGSSNECDVWDINPVEYSRSLKVKSIERRISRITAEKINAGDKLDEIREELAKKDVLTRSNGKTMAEVGAEFDKMLEQGIVKHDTGFSFLSKNYISYRPGHMWLITGRSSVGKTSVVVEMIASAQKVNFLLISTEMTEQQMYARLVSRFSGVHYQRLMNDSTLTMEEYERVNEAKQTVARLKVEVINNVIELSAIEALVSRKKAEGILDVLFVDYIQQLQARGTKSEYEKHSTLAARLYQLGMKNKVCIVCMSQISNTVARGDTNNFEAKGAGDWAAAADLGVRLKRDDENSRSVLVFDVQKNRHGAVFQQSLEFVNNWTRLVEI
jgi:replicative DNA helicase